MLLLADMRPALGTERGASRCRAAGGSRQRPSVVLVGRQSPPQLPPLLSELDEDDDEEQLEESYELCDEDSLPL